MPTIEVLKFRYENALSKLKELANRPDFSEIGGRIFYDQFQRCKHLHNLMVDLENAGQSK